MRSKSYNIKINPIAWQRVVRRDSKEYNTHTRDKVAFGLYLSQQHNEEPMYEKAIHMDVVFYMSIPKPVKERVNSLYHSNPPSLEQLYRFFLDAIKDILITDDRVICSLSLKKVYDKEPRTELTITEV